MIAACSAAGSGNGRFGFIIATTFRRPPLTAVASAIAVAASSTTPAAARRSHRVKLMVLTYAPLALDGALQCPNQAMVVRVIRGKRRQLSPHVFLMGGKQPE